MNEQVKSALTEVEVNESMLESGRTLREIVLPENTLVMMICRDGDYFVPQGKTELHLGDKLLVSLGPLGGAGDDLSRDGYRRCDEARELTPVRMDMRSPVRCVGRGCVCMPGSEFRQPLAGRVEF